MKCQSCAALLEMVTRDRLSTHKTKLDDNYIIIILKLKNATASFPWQPMKAIHCFTEKVFCKGHDRLRGISNNVLFCIYLIISFGISLALITVCYYP